MSTFPQADGSPLKRAANDLFTDHPRPFVLDEDNRNHLVVKDCCGGEVMSSHLPMVGVNVFMEKDHLRARLIARVLVALSQENTDYPGTLHKP